MVVKDLRSEWMRFEAGAYQPLDGMSPSKLNTVYFPLVPDVHKGDVLRLHSHKPYYLFINGKVYGMFQGEAKFAIDSLSQIERSLSWMIAIHQKDINGRDLQTEIVSRGEPVLAEALPMPPRPYWHLRDFVVLAGLAIILLFLLTFRLNPKLTADYFSIARLFSSRDLDESQTSARLTGSTNMQFYVLCSLLVGFYLSIVLHHLPPRYALPRNFDAATPGAMWLVWLKLSAIVFFVLVVKALIIYSLTRLFAMRGVARFHFFNWIRLLLLAFGAGTIALFIYFITRGDSANIFVMFLSLVIATLIGWAIIAFFKLSGRSGHSVFHLFSYLCATEIIPLLITVKVLFQ